MFALALVDIKGPRACLHAQEHMQKYLDAVRLTSIGIRMSLRDLRDSSYNEDTPIWS